MIRVRYDLESAIAALEKESKPILKEHQSQLYFHPDRKRKKKRAMKQKTERKPGGRFNNHAPKAERR